MALLDARDLDEIQAQTSDLWHDLRGARLLVTGGTGFIGTWLLESLRHADRRLGLGVRATILTRDPAAFSRKAPHLMAAPAFDVVQGDVCSLPRLEGSYTHVIHAATDASARLVVEDPLQMFDTIVLGTRHVLDWARAKGVERTLFVSSGAVYGPQPQDMERIPEAWEGSLDCLAPKNVYAEGKRAAENLCGIYWEKYGLPVSIARCFAFVGPHLPLDVHFAIGNFIRDAMAGGPVQIKGDGTPMRSYLYAGDMAAWLWHLLLRGEPGAAVNVGSEVALSIRELGELVARLLGGVACHVLGTPNPGRPRERYIPSVQLARQRYGLSQTLPLDEAILRTARWHGFKA